MTEKRKTFTVFSAKLAAILIFRGFVVAGTARSNIDRDKTVFFFFDSDELQEAITDYKNKKYVIKEITTNAKDEHRNNNDREITSRR